MLSAAFVTGALRIKTRYYPYLYCRFFPKGFKMGVQGTSLCGIKGSLYKLLQFA